jgi:hypothetical protein
LFWIKLRAGIARGRLCASVLVIPQRKMVLIRTLYRRRPWIDLELHHWPWGSSSEREERGTGRGRGGGGLGAPWGGAARRSSAPTAPVRSARLFGPAVSRREGGTREEKEKQGKKKEEKM